MALFFRSQTARPVELGDRTIRFTLTGSFAGLPRGVFAAEDEIDQYVLRMLSADPASAIEEINQTQWEVDMRVSYAPPPAPPPSSKGLINRIGEVLGQPFVAGAKQLPANLAYPAHSDPTTIIQLGRAGDLINILPVAHAMARATISGKTRIVVGREYARILDGCSYVEAIPFEGHVSDDYLKAVQWAHSKCGGQQFATQLYFSGAVHGRQTESFVLDNWIKAGFSPQWWDELRPVFDQRDAMGETILIRSYQIKKPMLLYNFTGTSSPFTKWFPEQHQKLMTVLEGFARDYTLVNLGDIRVERFYDLLGLMDAAAGMITIDTATLHLAGASRCPYIALITDTPTPWHGSVPRGNCIMQVRYGEVDAKLDRIGRAIESFSDPVICHLWTSPRLLDQDTNRRHTIAARTWKNQGWVERKVGDYAVDRVFQCNTRALPYLKDMVDIAVNSVRDQDIVVLTNADICCAKTVSRDIRKALRIHECLWCNRRDFPRLDGPVERVSSGQWYPGTDLFAFKAAWWKRRRDMMPDMVFGAEGWDLCMRVLMQEDHGAEMREMIYHEKHDSAWERTANRFTWKSQVHNRALASAFCILRGHDPKPHGL